VDEVTDEGRLGDPMDEAEALAAIQNMAKLMRAFYESLASEGFSEADALKLTASYVHGTAGGKLE
jgi:hypothetical protein